LFPAEAVCPALLGSLFFLSTRPTGSTFKTSHITFVVPFNHGFCCLPPSPFLRLLPLMVLFPPSIARAVFNAQRSMCHSSTLKRLPPDPGVICLAPYIVVPFFVSFTTALYLLAMGLHLLGRFYPQTFPPKMLFPPAFPPALFPLCFAGRSSFFFSCWRRADPLKTLRGLLLSFFFFLPGALCLLGEVCLSTKRRGKQCFLFFFLSSCLQQGFFPCWGPPLFGRFFEPVSKRPPQVFNPPPFFFFSPSGSPVFFFHNFAWSDPFSVCTNRFSRR